MSHWVGSRVVCSHLVRMFVSRSLGTSCHLSRESGLVPGYSSNQDILLKSIRSSKETSDVLHYIDRHHSIMNMSHLLQAFKVIFCLQKSETTVMSNGEVLNSAEFHTLCRVLKSRVRSLEINDTVDVLKTLSYLGVPASSKLVTILLNMIASRVNELSLQQIIFLDFLVKDFKSTPIVEALRIALPVVFQANLLVKVDRDNVNQACFLLHFASKKKLPEACIDSLVDIIMKRRERLDLNGAMSVVRAICDLTCCDESHRPLLHHALDIVLDAIDSCSFSDLDVLFSKLVYKYSKDNYFFYHEAFANSVCSSVIENDCGFEEALWTLRKLNKLGHVDTKLLDYLTDKVVADPNLCDNRSPTIFILAKGFAIADYRPADWATLEPILTKCLMKAFEERADMPWMSLVRDLCTVGVWPLSIVERMFQQDFLEKYYTKYNTVLDQLQVLNLYQEVVTLCPDQFTTKPPPHILENAININGKNVAEFPLLESLERGLGGSAYVATGVHTKLGHYLHHVIVLRKGGYPTALNQLGSELQQGGRVCLEDLTAGVSEEHVVVAVQHLTSSFYCTNTHRLKGLVRQQLDSMRALGLVVLPVSSDQWETLLQHERIPYLMRAINETCQHFHFAQLNT